MRFDRKMLSRLGIAIGVVVALALYGQYGGERISTIENIEPTDDAVAPAAINSEPTTSIDAPASPNRVPVSDADFDFYVLVLSWSPTHCSSDAGRGRDDELQCRSGRPFGFVLHGLWPQHERGYPQSCESDQPRSVSSAVMRDALKLSPSEQLIQHEWEKHGTCAGLSQEDYFATAALAVEAVKVPRAYVSPQRPIVTTPNDVRRAFLDANRSIPKDGFSATCSRKELGEVWVCLDKGLAPRACSNDVRKRHCGGREVRMMAVRGDWPR